MFNGAKSWQARNSCIPRGPESGLPSPIASTAYFSSMTILCSKYVMQHNVTHLSARAMVASQKHVRLSQWLFHQKLGAHL